jgi:hypothetical protein
MENFVRLAIDIDGPINILFCLCTRDAIRKFNNGTEFLTTINYLGPTNLIQYL